jgi:uncharacterized membrane protein
MIAAGWWLVLVAAYVTACSIASKAARLRAEKRRRAAAAQRANERLRIHAARQAAPTVEQVCAAYAAHEARHLDTELWLETRDNGGAS